MSRKDRRLEELRKSIPEVTPEQAHAREGAVCAWCAVDREFPGYVDYEQFCSAGGA